MNMPADVRHVGNHLQRLVAHVFGVRRSEADAHLGGFLGHAAEKVSKRSSLLIRIHILPQQRHFLETTVAQVAHLAQDALHVARALAAASVGHDAVVAEVVAAAHDAHEAANLMAQANTLGHHVAVGLGGRQINVDGLVPQLGLRHEVGQRHIGVGAGHEVGTILLKQFLLHALSHAA